MPLFRYRSSGRAHQAVSLLLSIMEPAVLISNIHRVSQRRGLDLSVRRVQKVRQSLPMTVGEAAVLVKVKSEAER